MYACNADDLFMWPLPVDELDVFGRAPTTMSASAAVGEVLRSPDDLLKLAAYRKKLIKEKAALDAKLSSGVKAQLDATRDALLKLQASKAAVALIREEMMSIEKLKGESEHEGEAFTKIARVGLPVSGSWR
jgi:exocyst complex component 3